MRPARTSARPVSTLQVTSSVSVPVARSVMSAALGLRAVAVLQRRLERAELVTSHGYFFSARFSVNCESPQGPCDFMAMVSPLTLPSWVMVVFASRSTLNAMSSPLIVPW